MSTCLCVCVHVGGCLKSFFHIGPLASAITQLYFPSVYNFFKERHSKGRTSTRSERHRKKDRKQNLARKIPPFVEQFKYDSHIKEVDNKKWLDCVSRTTCPGKKKKERKKNRYGGRWRKCNAQSSSEVQFGSLIEIFTHVKASFISHNLHVSLWRMCMHSKSDGFSDVCVCFQDVAGKHIGSKVNKRRWCWNRGWKHNLQNYAWLCLYAFMWTQSLCLHQSISNIYNTMGKALPLERVEWKPILWHSDTAAVSLWQKTFLVVQAGGRGGW